MNFIFTFLLLLSVSSAVFSQANNNPLLDSVIKEKSKNIIFSETQDHFMFNFTIDNVMAKSTDSGFNSSWFNPNFGFYFMYDQPLGKSGFSIAPGVGFTFSKVNLTNSILTGDTSGTYFENPSKLGYGGIGNRRYEDGSFYNSWLEAPIELRWFSKPLNGRSRFKVAVGMRFGVRLASNSKVNYIDPTLGEMTMKTKPYTGINGIRYGATIRVGYGAFNLFWYYGMSQLIKDSENPRGHDLRQYSIGISLTGL